MRSFFLALAITGINAYYAQDDGKYCPYTPVATEYTDVSNACTNLLAADPALHTDGDSCDAMPYLAIALYSSRNYYWRAYEVTTSDGYILNMGRISANDRNESNYQIDAGPILLLHGAYGDELSWFGISDDDFDTLIESLYDRQGHDVWIASLRGT